MNSAMSTTRYCEWYYETLRGTTSGTTRHYVVLRVVQRDTVRYYEWYYESLRDTTSGTTRHCEVLRMILRVTMWYYITLREVLHYKKSRAT